MFAHLGTEKCKFKVAFTPLSVKIHSPINFDLALQIKRGGQDAVQTAPVKCMQSLNKTDIRTIEFPIEEIILETSFFVEKDGTPQ